MTAVFLDLDGTLVDSKPGILSSLAAAFTEVGRPDLAAGDLTWMIGPPFAESFGTLNLADPQIAIDAYRRLYDDGGALYDAEVYPGIPTMLADLRAEGRRLYLATAKPHVAATKVTRHFGLAPSFTAEFGPELDGTRNWKGDLLAYALEMTGEDPSRSVMVGDRHHDVAAAAEVGMACIAVRWGYGLDHEWDGVQAVVDVPADVPAAIRLLGL